MFEFNIWHSGMIIDHLRADSLAKAQNLAKKMFSSPVIVTPLRATPEENAAAKAASLKL